MPKISILLPVRDAAPWLDEALESIEAQTFSDFEVVAVDDGSTDGSSEILLRHARRDSRIVVVAGDRHEQGVVGALNTGLARVRGALVARMDADDRSDPRRLAVQVEALRDDSCLAAATCRVAPFPESALGDGMRRYFEWQNGLLRPEDLRRDRFVESPLMASSLLIRTQVLAEELGGWADTGWAEDWDLLLRLWERGHRIVRVPETLHWWRIHEAQATQTHPRYREDRFLVARAHFLARELRRVAANRTVRILGAGPVGKRLARALAEEDFDVDGFIDVDPRKIGGRIGPTRKWPVDAMDALFAEKPRPYAISAVGLAGGRERVRALLRDKGWTEGADFVVAA